MGKRYALHRVRSKDLEVGDIHAPNIGPLPATGLPESALRMKARVGLVTQEGTYPEQGKPRIVVKWVNDPDYEQGPEWFGIYGPSALFDVYREIPGSSGVVEIPSLVTDTKVLFEAQEGGRVVIKVSTGKPYHIAVQATVDAKRTVRTLKALMPEAFGNGNGA